ncbi:methyltransferase domain-containing protein [Flocculibacter collagenilyticus]|uniref:methyltransferase domain-containing protein n=1 Tax=Flocculibacter collagenilyticus TaxID=2744479 RepID=UPI001F405E19|nr:methyltransferase domain-containing protein [Flocculibacter collagenilyticus]
MTSDSKKLGNIKHGNTITNDTSFDQSSKKFKKNIYGTTKGKLRLAVLKRDLMDIPEFAAKPLRILDIGCGQGQLGVWCASLGHEVVFSDVSEDMLTEAYRTCTEQGLLNSCSFVAGSLQTILPQLQKDHQAFDIILCHAVFEWLDEPKKALNLLVDTLTDNGHLSLMYYNQIGKALANILYGNFEYVNAEYKARNTVFLNPQNPINSNELMAWISELPLNCLFKTGVRCFHDYTRDRNLPSERFDELVNIELSHNRQEPFASIGRYTHLVLRKNE